MNMFLNVPLWANIALAIIGLLLLVPMFLLARQVIFGVRYREDNPDITAGQLIRSGVAGLVCLLLAVWLIAGQCLAFAAAKRQSEPNLEYESTETEDGAEPELPELDDDEIYIDMSEDDIIEWLSVIYGEKWGGIEWLQKSYLDNQDPKNQETRKLAVREALVSYYGSKDFALQGFDDPVDYPFEVALEAMKSGKIQEMSVAEKEEFLQNIRYESYQVALQSPVYGDMYVQFIRKVIETNPEILELNKKWLQWLLDENEKAFSGYTDETGVYHEPVGVPYFFEKISKDKDPRARENKTLRADYLSAMAQLLKLVNGWGTDVINPIQGLKSEVRWSLSNSVDPNFVRITMLDTPALQEDLLALKFALHYKGGAVAQLYGINLFDGSLEILTEATSSKSPASSGGEETETKKQDHLLTIRYVIADTGKEPFDRIKVRLYKGQSYKYSSKSLDGYTVDQPVVQGKMPDHDLSITVTYTKKSTVVKQGLLTIHMIYEDGSTAFPDHTEWVKVGKTYTFTPPTKKGYTHNPKKVSGSMTEEGATYTVIYKAKKFNLKVYLTDMDGNKLRQEPYVDRAQAYGSYYKIYAPQLVGYTAYDQYVDGYMPNENVVRYIRYTKNAAEKGLLTVHMIYSDGSTAFPDHTEWVEVGKTYSFTPSAKEGYTHSPTVVEGVMAKGGVERTVVYTKNTTPPPTTIDPDPLPPSPPSPDPDIPDNPDPNPPKPDGEGGKDPDDSTANQQEEAPSGPNLPEDGAGEDEPEETPPSNTPPQTNPDQETSGQHVNDTGDYEGDSKDHSEEIVEDPEGGNTDNGSQDLQPDPEPDHNTSVGGDENGNGGENPNSAPVNNETIDEPV